MRLRASYSRSSPRSAAIDASAPTILSSALTTFVGLVMLIFIKFKIGADVGWVLSKGVVFSLLCNFTVLPGLILMFEKAIQKTGKRTPSVPVAPVARFERAFRWPLTVLFVAIFVGAFILQKRTEITFSAYWPTPITDAFPPDNPVMLLYDTAEEASIPDLLDSLSQDPDVVSTLSYPSLALKQLTAKEMTERFSSISPLITEELLDVVYYAKVHPKRTERLRLSQLEESANILAEGGLIPAGLDIDSLTLPPEEPEEEPEEVPVEEVPVPVEETPQIQDVPDIEDTLVAEEPSAAPADTTAPGLSYEDVTTR